MDLTGDPDGPAYRAGISVFDVMTGLHSAIGILAALHHRDETGVGQLIETNLLSTALSTLVNQTSAYVAGGVVPHRMGNAHLSLFPYEPMPTGDGELIVVAGNDGQFRKLCRALGRPELADDPRFATVGQRNDNREALRPLLLERARDPLGPGLVRHPDRGRRAVRADQRRPRRGRAGRASSVSTRWCIAGDVPTVRNPIRLSATPARYDLAPPALDADGDRVREWLGFSPDESSDQ